MPKKPIGEPLDIPPECFEAKAQFWSFESALAKVKEIKAIVAMTGQPHMVSYHTHSAPPQGAKIVYLDEFELPAEKRKLSYFAPCPCCSPRHPKYGVGKIAWFPEEGVIRLMGPHCFAKLDKGGHNDALVEMRKRKQRDADVAYLLRNHNRLTAAYRVIQTAIQVAEAIDEFGKNLRHTVEDLMNVPLWERVRHGHLQVWETFSDFTKGNEIVQRQMLRNYAKLEGYQLLNPRMKDYSIRVQQCIIGFITAFASTDWDHQIAEMSETNRHDLAKLVDKSVRRARELLGEMRELQRFLSVSNVATLRTWGPLVENPTQISFDRQGKLIRIGKTEHGRNPITIPAHFDDEIGEIDVPLLSEMVSE